MGETLTQQRRVEDEVPWDVNSFDRDDNDGTVEEPRLTSCQQPR